MVQINFARREVNCKIVFYGPGLSGKTTNLEIIHKKVPDNVRGNLTSIATEQDRTLFFDFMPLDLGQVAGMKTKLFLYTVPGQVYYDSTRKLVLQGADGVSFIADSDPSRMNDNLESFRNLEKNLKDYGIDIRKLPLVIQYNKRDLPGALSIAELNAKVNPLGVPTFEAVAVKGEGVMQTLKGISKLVVEKLNEEYAPVKTSSPVGGVTAPPARSTPAVGTVIPPVPAAPQVSVPRPVAPAAPPPRPVAPAAWSPAPAPPPRPVAPAVRPPAPLPPPVRPAAFQPAPAPQSVRAAPSGGKGRSMAWLWILLLIVVLGGGFVMAWERGLLSFMPPFTLW
jgi:hypothetical protein